MKYLAVFWGKVIGGKQRGKSLGFATANVRLHKNISEAVYISRASFDKKWRPALTFVGSSKTFGETDVKAETFLLDFEGNLYGKWLTVNLLKKIRGNKKFANQSQLIDEMKKDKKIAEEYFKNV